MPTLVCSHLIRLAGTMSGPVREDRFVHRVSNAPSHPVSVQPSAQTEFARRESGPLLTLDCGSPQPCSNDSEDCNSVGVVIQVIVPVLLAAEGTPWRPGRFRSCRRLLTESHPALRVRRSGIQRGRGIGSRGPPEQIQEYRQDHPIHDPSFSDTAHLLALT